MSASHPFKIKTYNKISRIGLAEFPAGQYEVSPEAANPDGILLRSQSLHDLPIPDSLKAVARAGSGVNNIPVPDYSKRGIPVFNAPGANANAVTELTIAGLLIAARNITEAWQFTKNLAGDGEELEKAVEQGKKNFAGFELAGKTLGVIGLGAIGVKVSNAASALGMKVLGFDPQMTVESAWQLSSQAIPARSVDEILTQSDFITVHVPLNEHTRQFLNAERFEKLKPGATLLNFSRAAVVDESAVLNALESSRLHAYISDFPSRALLNQPRAVVLPHLGASTAEAEDKCAVMVAKQLKDFLENGNIRHAVNFPDVNLPRTEGYRLAIANENVPSMVSQITTLLAEHKINIIDMLNKSRGDYAYTLIDVNNEISPELYNLLRSIQGILSVRII